MSGEDCPVSCCAADFKALLYRRVRSVLPPFPMTERPFLPWALCPLQGLFTFAPRVTVPGQLPTSRRQFTRGCLPRLSEGKICEALAALLAPSLAARGQRASASALQGISTDLHGVFDVKDRSEEHPLGRTRTLQSLRPLNSTPEGAVSSHGVGLPFRVYRALGNPLLKLHASVVGRWSFPLPP